MRRAALLVAALAASPALAEGEVFHGWSKDGSYLVYEARGHDELVELFFCLTNPAVKASWPKGLDELDRIEATLSCVRFIDANKAPYQWRATLVKPGPSAKGPGGLVVLPELATDGETPGFVLELGGKKQSCYVSGLREDSRLGAVHWHPSGKWVAALVDGKLAHCEVQLKPAKAPAKKK